MIRIAPTAARAVLCGVMTLVSAHAYAATISVAGSDCGTPQLLGLSFVTTTGSNIGTGSVGCPEVGIGAIIDPIGGGGSGSPLYGLNITSIGFRIVDPTGNPPTVFVDPLSSLGAGMTFTDPGAGFVLNDPKGIEIVCRSIGDVVDTRPICSPPDVSIFFSGFNPGTQFIVTSVNGVAAVPEPATLSLFGGGLALAALRRRRRSR